MLYYCDKGKKNATTSTHDGRKQDSREGFTPCVLADVENLKRMAPLSLCMHVVEGQDL